MNKPIGDERGVHAVETSVQRLTGYLKLAAVGPEKQWGGNRCAGAGVAGWPLSSPSHLLRPRHFCVSNFKKSLPGTINIVCAVIRDHEKSLMTIDEIVVT